ncbi:Protein phosphatase 2C 7 [Saxophila tyrrhenica]|uniref:Protein phosphatase n=1 Tax=Saxophila tyrrhenica TaxID=1690608 RepID=A0AAV9PKX3_9PEZI|nr:Protein phosphatase 2C 7 [Saxophila tyrrhenica]
MPYIVPKRAQSTASSAFTYRLAAAASAKRSPPRNPKHQKDFWNYISTQEHKNPPYLRSTKPDSGEDAFFATTLGDSDNHVAFGVADGVGGWQDQGIDPSVFSHGLCGLMAGTAQLHSVEDSGMLRPQALLQTAYDAVIANPRILAGGSTACLAVIDHEGAMETANLGDSGYMVFGPGKVAYKSDVQTHAFNTPFQMAKVPTKMMAQYAIFGGESSGGKHFSETPRQAEVVRQNVKHGDVVVFATDGVWDNLSAQDTLSIVTRVMMEKKYWIDGERETTLDATRIAALPASLSGPKEHEEYLPAILATAIMREAKLAGLDPRRNGPFAKEVNARYPQEGWEGGKADDIAVVVCIAVDGSLGRNGDDTGSERDEKPVKAKL